VTQPPAERDLHAHDAVVRIVPRTIDADQEVRPSEVWAAVWRHRWLILACVVCSVALAAFLTSRATPVYQASATLKVEVKEPNLPGFFKSPPDGGELGTEARVLESRTLAEAAATALALQFRMLEPLRVARDDLFDGIRVARDAAPASYHLKRRADGRYVVLSDSTQRSIATVRPGEALRLPGVRFRLASKAASYETMAISIQSFTQAALGLLGNLTVAPAGRDVNILNIEYEDPDPGLVWRVPNSIVGRYLERRRDVAKAEARSTVVFLRQQLDTVSAQLAVAEDALRRYRQRNRVIDPQGEATSQVQRLVSLQSERASIDGERTALGKLLEQVDAKAASQHPGDPSPYRELIAFPTLLRSQIATGLLQSLSTIEQERVQLLARRTPTDPDVQALDGRMKELQTQLRSVVVTYLQGLTNQVTTLDTGLEQFGKQLGTLPQLELDVARLERKPKVLDEISTLLQTRLKEAEIAEAAGDLSVQVLDPAAPPHAPYRPSTTANLFAGLLGGLLLGGLTTFVREHRDRTVHTRGDIQIATGLPVLGLIPTIRRTRWSMKRIALITEKQRRRVHHPGAAPVPPLVYSPAEAPFRGRSTYSLWPTSPADDSPAGGPPSGAEEPASQAGRLKLTFTEAGYAAAEAYGILQTNIAFSLPDRPVQILVVTSALPAEGKTTNAVNLALSLVRRGLRVLVMDADLRRGAVHAAFETTREPGLTDVLRGAMAFTRARRSVDVEGHAMHYLTAGSPASNATALLESQSMRDLLGRLREEYDGVIVDSPPTNLVTDAAVLGAMADGVIVVARSGVTESAALGSAMEQLLHVRAPVLGVVLNDINFKRDAVYDASYRHYNYDQYLSSTPS
jgi:polysaccharide biosynthesis transport protein